MQLHDKLSSNVSIEVEKIEEDGLDLISSSWPSENSNYWRESFQKLIRKNIAGCHQQTFENKNFVDITQQCFAFTPQASFPAHNLNFHSRWGGWDQI